MEGHDPALPLVSRDLELAAVPPDDPVRQAQAEPLVSRTLRREEGLEGTVPHLVGQAVAGIDDLQKLLDETRIGKRTAVTLIRRTQKLEFAVTPQEMPARHKR